MTLLFAAPALAHAVDTYGALFVETIEVVKQHANYRCPGCGSVAYAGAAVYVVDQNGNPVPYALVIGKWSDAGSGRAVSMTNAYGWAPFFSEPVSFNSVESPSFTFCITTIIKSGFSFDPAMGGQVCETAE